MIRPIVRSGRRRLDGAVHRQVVDEYREGVESVGRKQSVEARHGKIGGQSRRSDPPVPDLTRQARLGEGRFASAVAAPPWLMREKVAIPDRVAGYYHRPELMERIRPTGRRGTVLKAPGGFGKTTLLSEYCRSAREAGTLAGWLTLDIPDAPQILEAHLVLALQEAGLTILGGADDDAEPPASDRIAGLLRAIAVHGEACVLVLDELERIEDPDSLKLVNTLLHWAPTNLSIAMACRELPPGIDVASLVLSGHTALFDASHLRFSSTEIAGFLGVRMTRRELRTLVRESRGWPIAVRIAQNERGRSASVADPRLPDVAGNWIESRLWRGLEAEDRAFLLDVGLFGRIDGPLLDEVLDGHDLIRRVQGMPALVGLLETVRVAESDRWRLHPLIREHCNQRHRRENPERFRSLHRRIAEALARRGETLTAMWHAAQADAGELTARILEDAGAARLWQRDGIGCLKSACGLLTADVTSRHPRLALARCLVEMTTGRLDEARKTYRSAIEARPEPESGDARDFEVDECIARGMLCLYGSELLGSELRKTTLEDYKRFADDPDIDVAISAQFAVGLCIAYNQTAEFDAALYWADQAERRLGSSPYTRMSVDLYRGHAAMARGRADEAAAYYAGAYRTALVPPLKDPSQAVFVEIAMRELDLETHRATRLERAPAGIPERLFTSGAPLLAFAAASGTSAELTRLRKGADAAIEVVNEALEYARRQDLPVIVRHLGGLRVHLLCESGRSGAAESAWRRGGLPRDDVQCLRLDEQTWRELESIACARLRLLIATERFDAGRQFAGALCAVAEKREVRRTWMRGLALSVTLERDAGEVERMEARLVEFLRHYAETGYAAGAVRERAAFLPALEGLLDRQPDSAIRASAKGLLDLLRGVGGGLPDEIEMTPQELRVLEHLESMRDGEIAEMIGVTVPGVRYHVGKIFRKLGVNDRLGAVDRARRAGLLSMDPDT
ncbi:MAG: hypothetical protein OXI74_01330 [Rhodospirillaceae bacterium]|nr:hypothetical protein [Rhodospirillaceae bacterium]